MSRKRGYNSHYMKTNKILLILISVVIILVLFSFVGNQPADERYNQLAQCISDSGATFYGAFWCPNCQDQKKLFQGSEKLLPYKECSTPDGRSQTFACKEAGIKGYPTWEFSDGTRITDVLNLEELSEYTKCPLIKEGE